MAQNSNQSIFLSVSKIASGYKKPDGLTTITPDKISEFMETLNLDDIHGIGKKTVQKLAEEEIERTLSFSNDVDDIRADTEKFLKKAEEIAIEAKKPGNLFKAGLREIEFGSLREGEMLFRESKKKSKEIIDWWEKARIAIQLAKNMLEERENLEVTQLNEILSDAKALLQSEEPKKVIVLAADSYMPG